MNENVEIKIYQIYNEFVNAIFSYRICNMIVELNKLNLFNIKVRITGFFEFMIFCFGNSRRKRREMQQNSRQVLHRSPHYRAKYKKRT